MKSRDDPRAVIPSLNASRERIAHWCFSWRSRGSHPRRGEGPEGDETRLRQIVINLLSNAGKFTHQGVVTLGVSRSASGGTDSITISVKDTGIGISPANLEKLFTNFSQAEVSTATKYGGTGLGLALSRNLCHLMHGEISVESEVGRGSIFTVRLRAGNQPDPAVVPPAPDALATSPDAMEASVV